MTELVANAAKYAYPDGARGSIRVRLTRADGEVARLSVCDEGVGLPSDFDTTSKKTGFGMRLVKALAKQMCGQLRIERRTRGTEFVLEIPRTEERSPPG